MITPLNTILFQPLNAAFNDLGSLRDCPQISDPLLAEIGVRRVLETVQSGRDFLQLMPSLGLPEITLRAYFNALHSGRRLAVLKAVQQALQERMLPALRQQQDRLAAFPELNGREVWSGDGHEIAHACHEATRVDAKGVMKYDATQGIFARDLRTGWVRVLAQCRGNEHEWKTLTREMGQEWRLGSRPGTIWIYDPAAVDLGRWYKLKQTYGVYFISRFKDNLRPVHSIPLEWDRKDPRNEGVISDHRVGFNNSGEFRRIEYRDPETGTEYVFLTNDMKLPPGVIGQLYRLRWDIEKSFDEFESKLLEKKAWATSDNAKRMQNEFIALAHNLMLCLSRRLEQEEQITDEKIEKKYDAWIQAREQKAQAQSGKRVSIWIKKLRMATQFSCQFIRWLRNHLRFNAAYEAAVAALRPLMLKYLT